MKTYKRVYDLKFWSLFPTLESRPYRLHNYNYYTKSATMTKRMIANKKW